MTGSKSRLREQAVAALLAEPTLDRAARVAGISEKTLRRWQHDDADFRAAYTTELPGQSDGHQATWSRCSQDGQLLAKTGPTGVGPFR
jgi:hypothetical protein